MEHICQKEGVDLDEGEIDDRIEQIAKESARDPFELLDEYEESGRLGMLREQILQDKTFELLKKHAVIRHTDLSDETEGTGDLGQAEASPAEGTPEPEETVSGEPEDPETSDS